MPEEAVEKLRQKLEQLFEDQKPNPFTLPP